MSIQFKPFTDAYIDQAAEIYNYYIKHTTVTFHTEAVTAEEMRDILYHEEPLYITLGIFDGDELCGYAYLAPYKKRQAYRVSAEVTLYLKPQSVGKGIGPKVLDKLESHAREQGIHALLAVICGENEASLRLFDKCGYEKCGHMKEIGMKFDRLLDVVIMQKIMD